jgi:hypothetical protein
MTVIHTQIEARRLSRRMDVRLSPEPRIRDHGSTMGVVIIDQLRHSTSVHRSKAIQASLRPIVRTITTPTGRPRQPCRTPACSVSLPTQTVFAGRNCLTDLVAPHRHFSLPPFFLLYTGSEELSKIQLFIPRECAHDTIYELGETGNVHLLDVSLETWSASRFHPCRRG